jgi:cytochrome c oxidase cbb3-type subunit 3
MQSVASYIISLEGTNPPNPKDPQGEIWVEDGESATSSDATVEETIVAEPDPEKEENTEE